MLRQRSTTIRILSEKKYNDDIYIRGIGEIKEIIEEENISIAMITVPAAAAQSIADDLVKYGIKGIITYAPVILNLPEEIRIEYIDPVLSLQHITYYLE